MAAPADAEDHHSGSLETGRVSSGPNLGHHFPSHLDQAPDRPGCPLCDANPALSRPHAEDTMQLLSRSRPLVRGSGPLVVRLLNRSLSFAPAHRGNAPRICRSSTMELLQISSAFYRLFHVHRHPCNLRLPVLTLKPTYLAYPVISQNNLMEVFSCAFLSGLFQQFRLALLGTGIVQSWRLRSPQRPGQQGNQHPQRDATLRRSYTRCCLAPESRSARMLTPTSAKDHLLGRQTSSVRLILRILHYLPVVRFRTAFPLLLQPNLH